MPPEHEDSRARQREALRWYFAGLGGQRDRPTVEAAEPQPASEPLRRPSRPWPVLTGLLVVVALVGGVLVGAVAWSDDRPVGGGTGTGGASSAMQRPTATAGRMASAACKTAVDRANAMLASTVKLRRALAEHDRVLRDPSNRRLSGSEVLEKLAPSLRAGSSESARFDRALDAYRRVVDRCELQVR
jgi:hypothetical protein